MAQAENTPGRKAAYRPPGRLGDPNMDLRTEPRLHPKAKEILASLGADVHRPPPALPAKPSLQDIAQMLERMEQSEHGTIALYKSLRLSLPTDESEIEVERTVQTIKGGDGQDMIVYIYAPASRDSASLPCVVYFHGGAMVYIPTMNPVGERWCRSLAAQGLVVAMVDFRNAWTSTGWNHFPAGLNDCAAAVHWLSSPKTRSVLKIKSLVLQGESGGANLSMAAALKANREGWIDEIAGVYGIVPYISGAYGWTEEEKLQALPSLVECDGYFLNMVGSAHAAHFYSPAPEDRSNPLAWPYHASQQDVKGLPPHILVMDELDPFRDEGVNYARRLAEAGVSVRGIVNLGVPHGTSLALRAYIPENNAGAVSDIAAFAKSL
jgi:acetyl esterase/lipase